MEILTIKWDLLAKRELQNIYNHIKEKSLQGAETVKNDILNATRKLENPVVTYAVDPDLGDPYRFIMVRNRYRIIHKRQETEVYIVFVFDTRQNREKLNEIRNSTQAE